MEYSSKNVYFFSRVKERQIEGTEFKGNLETIAGEKKVLKKE